MSAARLREAADKIREGVEIAAAQPAVAVNARGVWLNNRYHLTLSVPAALALADWLEKTADHMDPELALDGGCPDCEQDGALVVADAYLNT